MRILSCDLITRDMRYSLLRSLLIIALWLFASCSSKPSSVTEVEQRETPSNTDSPLTHLSPAVAEIIANGEHIPYEICAQNLDWVRPSEEEQRSVWESSRYSGVDQDVLKYPWDQDFFITYGSASINYDIINLSGLWTLPEGTRDPCFEEENQDAILKFKKAEIWVLNHSVTEIRRASAKYAIIVEPIGRGVQFLHFYRLSGNMALTLYFVTSDGSVIDHINETEYPYWPNP